jgi:hypothetical protein
MKFKHSLGAFLLILSGILIFSDFPFNQTGNVVSYYFTGFNLSHFLGLILLFLSLILLIQREGLEYLVVPIGIEKMEGAKAKSAEKLIERHKNEGHYIDRVVLTGDIEREKKRHKEHFEKNNPVVYDSLRKSGILPKQIKLLHGMDSEEDILYLGEMVKPGDTVYFDTFPLHFREYVTLVKKAQRDNKFPKNIKLRNARIPQDRTEFMYGLLGWMEEVLKRRPLSYKSQRESALLDKIKSGVKNLIGMRDNGK